jgi:hypothetical protein
MFHIVKNVAKDLRSTALCTSTTEFMTARDPMNEGSKVAIKVLPRYGVHL